ncbi:OpgC domain-containing protein [Vibrio sp. dsl-7]|uniref:OpgC domain-containing protein n=1 Tax=Vibrio chanodichtyis TaxID=3027932 RepID=A0ABT5V2K8_9VIBR|nr:OpgC domain-containing protein [Vibrio chanodichtyis]MDE1515327.1 OpgC domain-containing protein [Vibrio chanodichtyis]
MSVNESTLPARLNFSYPSVDKRDLRIDMLRGMAMLMMVVAHVEVMSLFNILTWERFGLITGAEGFVILSGFVLGFLKRRQLQTEPLLSVSYSLIRRAVTLYVVNIVIILSILILGWISFIDIYELTHFVDRYSGVAYSMYPVSEQIKEAWFNQIIFLQIGPHQSQILGLYFYLLLLSPIFLWLLHAQRVFYLVILSLFLYCYFQLTQQHIVSAKFDSAFPLLAWQLIYVLGMSCGWYKDELLSLAKTQTGKWVIAAMVVIAMVMFFIAQNHTNLFMPSYLMLHVIPAEQFDWLYKNFAAKNELGPLRILNNACLIVSLYLLLTYCWLPINKLFGWFFIVLGQNSLYAFILHVYIVLLASQWVKFNLWEQHWVLNTLVHTLCLLALWLMAKFKVLKNIIPN